MLFLIADSHDKSVMESCDLSVNIQRGDGDDRGNSSVWGVEATGHFIRHSVR